MGIKITNTYTINHIKCMEHNNNDLKDFDNNCLNIIHHEMQQIYHSQIKYIHKIVILNECMFLHNNMSHKDTNIYINKYMNTIKFCNALIQDNKFSKEDALIIAVYILNNYNDSDNSEQIEKFKQSLKIIKPSLKIIDALSKIENFQNQLDKKNIILRENRRPSIYITGTKFSTKEQDIQYNIKSIMSIIYKCQIKQIHTITKNEIKNISSFIPILKNHFCKEYEQLIPDGRFLKYDLLESLSRVNMSIEDTLEVIGNVLNTIAIINEERSLLTEEELVIKPEMKKAIESALIELKIYDTYILYGQQAIEPALIELKIYDTYILYGQQAIEPALIEEIYETTYKLLNMQKVIEPEFIEFETYKQSQLQAIEKNLAISELSKSIQNHCERIKSKIPFFIKFIEVGLSNECQSSMYIHSREAEEAQKYMKIFIRIIRENRVKNMKQDKNTIILSEVAQFSYFLMKTYDITQNAAIFLAVHWREESSLYCVREFKEGKLTGMRPCWDGNFDSRKKFQSQQEQFFFNPNTSQEEKQEYKQSQREILIYNRNNIEYYSDLMISYEQIANEMNTLVTNRNKRIFTIITNPFATLYTEEDIKHYNPLFKKYNILIPDFVCNNSDNNILNVSAYSSQFAFRTQLCQTLIERYSYSKNDALKHAIYMNNNTASQIFRHQYNQCSPDLKKVLTENLHTNFNIMNPYLEIIDQLFKINQYERKLDTEYIPLTRNKRSDIYIIGDIETKFSDKYIKYSINGILTIMCKYQQNQIDQITKDDIEDINLFIFTLTNHFCAEYKSLSSLSIEPLEQQIIEEQITEVDFKCKLKKIHTILNEMTKIDLETTVLIDLNKDITSQITPEIRQKIEQESELVNLFEDNTLMKLKKTLPQLLPISNLDIKIKQQDIITFE